MEGEEQSRGSLIDIGVMVWMLYRNVGAVHSKCIYFFLEEEWYSTAIRCCFLDLVILRGCSALLCVSIRPMLWVDLDISAYRAKFALSTHCKCYLCVPVERTQSKVGI